MVASTETTDGGEERTAVSRDAAGRVTAAEAARGRQRYRYDAAGQLVSASTPTGAWTWTYDAAGRLVDEDGPDGATTYTYDEAHQLVRIDGPAGTTAFSYDAAGRRVAEERSDGTRRYRWDAAGSAHRRRGARRAAGRGRRRRPRPARCPRRHGVHLGRRRGPVPELLAIGDREVVTAAGHVVGTVTAPAAPTARDRTAGAGRSPVPDGDADPWGAVAAGGPQAPSGPRLGALGELDLGGLTWLRNRVYDPATRSFLAPDPLPGIPGTPVASYPYHYAGNDPVGYVDPLGLQPLTLDQYNEYREQETSVQWGNIAMVGLRRRRSSCPAVPSSPPWSVPGWAWRPGSSRASPPATGMPAPSSRARSSAASPAGSASRSVAPAPRWPGR